MKKILDPRDLPKDSVVKYFIKKDINIDPEKSKKNWDDFWAEVQKNNEKLRYYSESGMY